MTFATRTDPNTGQQSTVSVEQGIPQQYIDRGATTVIQYQTMASQDLSDRQIQAQQDIAKEQEAFNQKQFDAQQAQYAQQQKQVEEQAQRQSTYDTGRAQELSDAQSQINDAFSRFGNDYFNQYAKDYMAKVQDQIDYQRRQAEKEVAFQTARQGISDSQGRVNQLGLIGETAGRTEAEQTTNAQTAAENLRGQVATARQNLMGQVINAASVGSPIAGSTIQDVNSALQTQRSAITPIVSSAGDIVPSLAAVPTVNTLSNIFGSIVGAGGAFLGGTQANLAARNVQAGLAGTNPAGSSTRLSLFG